MSDRFHRIPLQQLWQWISREYQTSSTIFGVHRSLFFNPSCHSSLAMTRYARRIETPLGVAAGPHSQLAQNIVTAWLTGSRFIELKTVQTLDRLTIGRPCIDMADEGYNCEWSQELSLDEAYDEYLNAFILVHLVRDLLGQDSGKPAGFLFNMSVGYDMAGIQQDNMQKFLARMADCSAHKQEKISALQKIHPRVADVPIPDCITDNVTLSTMHGCPPTQIEQIARYFIGEKKLHTTIKLNPTLLGSTALRHILNDTLRFPVEVPDEAFAHDPRFEDAVPMIARLLDNAQRCGVSFGLKLTNTLESVNKSRNLARGEKMAYMSGRALHPISIHVARKLQRAFNGSLDISFAGGVDCFNIADTIACGLGPVTVCSDLLKPGGYGRMAQYVEALASAPLALAALGRDDKSQALAYLESYAERLLENPAYRRTRHDAPSVKSSRPLAPFDCVAAPCVNECPAHQSIPTYLRLAAQGEYQKALSLILESNPMPHVTGMVCDHLCQSRCTRVHYDDALLIREVKRFIAAKCPGALPLTPPPSKNGKRAAIIGAGPSGLSAAWFLARAGFSVDVFEAKNFPGGMTADAIPRFRLSQEALRQDIARIEQSGVSIHLGQQVDVKKFHELRNTCDYVYVAIGAQQSKKLEIDGEDLPEVWDQLTFLSAQIKGERPHLGTRVAVIGGGNAAMDAARTAQRLVGVSGKVTIVYRRTRQEMPADAQEITAALAEGITLVELAAPLRIVQETGAGLQVICQRMTLGPADASGRARPVPLAGSEFGIPVDSVITALGQQIAGELGMLASTPSDQGEFSTFYGNVLIGGDAKRGASTVIKAIADGKHAADAIVGRSVPATSGSSTASDPGKLQQHAATRIKRDPCPELPLDRRGGFDPVMPLLDEKAVHAEAARCLSCDLSCNVCVTVCPNRANVNYQVKPAIYEAFVLNRAESARPQARQSHPVAIQQAEQVINIGNFCNECGNCATFCPTAGAPYRDKPKVYLDEASFTAEQDGFLLTSSAIFMRRDGMCFQLTDKQEHFHYDTADFSVTLRKHDLMPLADSLVFKNDSAMSADTHPAIAMAILWQGLSRKSFVFDHK